MEKFNTLGAGEKNSRFTNLNPQVLLETAQTDSVMAGEQFGKVSGGLLEKTYWTFVGLSRQIEGHVRAGRK